RKDTGMPISELKVDGGAVENNLLMELQATISNTKIIRPKVIETTAYGAALAAAVGAGLIKFDHVDKLWKQDKTFSPKAEWKEYSGRKKALWTDAIKRLYF